MRAFLTGSRVYGTPRADSDIDLVILVSLEDALALKELADSEGFAQQADDYPQPDGGRNIPLRFGKLNLICTTSEAWYESWLEGTNALRQQSAGHEPVTRLQAVEVFKAIRLREGLIKPRDK